MYLKAERLTQSSGTSVYICIESDHKPGSSSPVNKSNTSDVPLQCVRVMLDSRSCSFTSISFLLIPELFFRNIHEIVFRLFLLCFNVKHTHVMYACKYSRDE